MKTFQIGQTLKARSLCDHNMIYSATVISRTAKRITFLIDGDVQTRGIKLSDKGEFFEPFGRYSMSPTFWA